METKKEGISNVFYMGNGVRISNTNINPIFIVMLLFKKDISFIHIIGVRIL